MNKPARSRVNAIHEGMITPLHSESDGEVEIDETRAKWRNVFKNPKFQTLVRAHTHTHTHAHTHTHVHTHTHTHIHTHTHKLL